MSDGMARCRCSDCRDLARRLEESNRENRIRNAARRAAERFEANALSGVHWLGILGFALAGPAAHSAALRGGR